MLEATAPVEVPTVEVAVLEELLVVTFSGTQTPASQD
jgi:hypothetical protein